MEARDATALKYKRRVFPSTSSSIVIIAKIYIFQLFIGDLHDDRGKYLDTRRSDTTLKTLL
jgi:hypothetical protein